MDLDDEPHDGHEDEKKRFSEEESGIISPEKEETKNNNDSLSHILNKDGKDLMSAVNLALDELPAIPSELIDEEEYLEDYLFEEPEKFYEPSGSIFRSYTQITAEFEPEKFYSGLRKETEINVSYSTYSQQDSFNELEEYKEFDLIEQLAKAGSFSLQGTSGIGINI